MRGQCYTIQFYLRRLVLSTPFTPSVTCCLRMLSSSALRSRPGQAQIRASKQRRPSTWPLDKREQDVNVTTRLSKQIQFNGCTEEPRHWQDLWLQMPGVSDVAHIQHQGYFTGLEAQHECTMLLFIEAEDKQCTQPAEAPSMLCSLSRALPGELSFCLVCLPGSATPPPAYGQQVTHYYTSAVLLRT